MRHAAERRFRDASFDHVFSFCVLEHILDLEDVLKELARVLKPGGGLHVSVDSLANISDPDLLRKHKQDHFVVRYFGCESLKRTVQDAGFEVDRIFPILKSEYARLEFEQRIQRRQGSSSPSVSMLRYRRLARFEGESNSQNGIMIVAHAYRKFN